MSETAEWAAQTVEAPAPGVNTSGKTIAIFYARQIKDNFQSTAQQRPVFVEKIFIKKIMGGDNLLIHDQPVRDTDKEMYPREWERWEKTRDNRIPGIPIDNCHFFSDTQKAEFKALNIFTVEQFAGLPDSAASKIMGFYELRRKAQVFVEAGKDAELTGSIRAEAAARAAAQDAKIDALMAKIAELSAAQATAPKKTWSRRPKAKVDKVKIDYSAEG